MNAEANPRLPKVLEAHTRAADLSAFVARHSLASDGDTNSPPVPLGDGLCDALRRANRSRRLVRGIDEAEKVLAAERHGQNLADQRSGTERGVRLSRVAFVSDDGSAGFYRQVGKLLARDPGKLLVIKVDGDAQALGEAIYGPAKRARLVLVNHKDAVAEALLAALDDATA